MVSRVVLASLAMAGCVILAGCGGGSEDKAAQAFAQPLRKPAPELCSKGQHDTQAVRYRSLDGVCTALFAPMADPLPQPPAEGAPQRAAHAPFTWSSFLAWASSAFPQLFAGSFEDGVVGQYTYRYWPLTRHYLAVAGGESLYALGPATDWEIVYIGRLSELLCFVYPANCAAAAMDIPGNASTGATLAVGAAATSTIETQDDQDWFAVDLVAGVTYTFLLEGASTGKGTLSDPYLRLHNGAGAVVASNDDVSYPSNLNARIQYTATTAGRYYVAASAYQSTGSYQLSASSSGTGTGGTGGTGTGGTGTGGTGTGGTDGTGTGTGTGGTGGTVTTRRLTTSTSGTGQGTISPASGTTYAPGAIVDVYAQPQFFSEFAGWTSLSTACAGTRYGCRVTMDRDHSMQARFEPAMFVTSFDAEYSNSLANGCNWHVSWTGTRIELTYRLSNGSYVGRIRIKGRRVATVTRQYPGTNCSGADSNIDLSFDIGAQQPGAGAYARVRSFDGAGDEYLTLSTGGLPGPNDAVAGFVAGQISLQYTGTNRSGSTTLPVIVLTRLLPQ